MFNSLKEERDFKGHGVGMNKRSGEMNAFYKNLMKLTDLKRRGTSRATT